MGGEKLRGSGEALTGRQKIRCKREREERRNPWLEVRLKDGRGVINEREHEARAVAGN